LITQCDPEFESDAASRSLVFENVTRFPSDQLMSTRPKSMVSTLYQKFNCNFIRDIVPVAMKFGPGENDASDQQHGCSQIFQNLSTFFGCAYLLTGGLSSDRGMGSERSLIFIGVNGRS
jgi:hypothetical protein